MSEHIASYSCIPIHCTGRRQRWWWCYYTSQIAEDDTGQLFKKSYTKSAATSDLTEQQAIEAELNSYLQAPDADSETNPLVWWKINSATYPRVSLLAKRYLCIPATSSPSERAFSTGGNIVSCHRAALKPDTVDRLVFLAKKIIIMWKFYKLCALARSCIFLCLRFADLIYLLKLLND